MRHPLFNFLLSMKKGTEELNYGREHVRCCLQQYHEECQHIDKIIVDLGAGQGDDLQSASQVFRDTTQLNYKMFT